MLVATLRVLKSIFLNQKFIPICDNMNLSHILILIRIQRKDIKIMFGPFECFNQEYNI